MQTVAGVIYGSTKNLEVVERHPEFKRPKLVKIFNGFDVSQVPDMKFHLHHENISKVFESLFSMNKIRHDTIVLYKSLTFC